MNWRKSSYSADTANCVEVGWQRSTYCGSGSCVEVGWTRSTRCSSGSCVEVYHQDGLILVRDSKRGEQSPVIEYTADDWGHLVESFLANPLRTPGIGCRTLAAGGGWVWTKGGVALEFTDEEMQKFGDGLRAGEFSVEVLTRG